MPAAPIVLHIDDGREWRGGQHQVSLLAGGLRDLGISQKVVARADSPLAQRLRAGGIEIVPLDFKGELDFRAPRELARIAHDFGANILHAHTAHAHTLALRAFRRLQKEALSNNVPRVLSTRRVDFPVGRGFFSRKKYLFPGQHFIAISEAIRRELLVGGVDPIRIDLVASGVPPLPAEECLSREDARREFQVPDSAIAIATLGALVDHKGHRWLVEAAPLVLREIPDAHFYILGEGGLRPALEKQIRDLDLQSHVHLLGHIDRARFKLAGFDLYVSPSHLEGLGTSILDAMLAGLSVVAAGAGGVTDIIRAGETGFLAPVRDAERLASEVIRALKATAGERGKIIETARTQVEQKFSARVMVHGTVGVYRRLLDSVGA